MNCHRIHILVIMLRLLFVLELGALERGAISRRFPVARHRFCALVGDGGQRDLEEAWP